MTTIPDDGLAERAGPADAGTATRPDARHRTGLAFAVLAVVQASLIFTITLISVPLPDIGREFGLGSADLVLVQAAYGLPYSGLLLFGGRLADRFGGRRVFAAGLAVFGLASATAAVVPGFEALVAVRFTQGIGAALTAPAAVAVLRALFPSPAAFGRAMATWGGMSVLGATLGPLVSGVVTTWVSWRWMFAVPVAVAVLGLAVTRGMFPEGRAGSSSVVGLDPAGAVLATLGISVGSYGLIASGDHPWSSTTVLVPLGVGVVLLAAFVAVERRVRDPLLPPGFAVEPRRLVGVVGILLAAAASGLVSFVLSVYLQQVRDWSPLETAGGFVPFAVALIASNSAAARLVGRFGAGPVTVAGLLVGAGGFALLTGIAPDSSYPLGLAPGLVLLPIGASLIFSGTAVLTTTNVPPHQVGLAGGVMNTAMELGPTVGMAALMAVAATRAEVVNGYAWAFGTAAVVYVVAALVAIPLLRRATAPAAS
ncbi:MFS transporter [Streptoalloteichus hindustanus]|uniref:Major Facilitator Superfamily protein n=1 Tax=Streptoalloteichus hindustanus TaxID=2017 RepID=A0A1M5FE21_STRHI|nr:MFS transporter [Streptoalloteichus hindustanus]SHF89814.1 Major Facilitator Superfamily protein [Streptoalloteichus hindustanus]